MTNRPKSPKQRKADDKNQRKKAAASEGVDAGLPEKVSLRTPASAPVLAKAAPAVAKSAPAVAKVAPAAPAVAKVAPASPAAAKSAPAAPPVAKVAPVLAKPAPAARVSSKHSEPGPEAAATAIEWPFEAAGQGALAVNRKLMDIAQANFNSSLDLAKSLAAAKTPLEMLRLQMSYWHERMGALASQAEELRALSAEVVANASEPIRAQMRRSLLARAA
jgi:hypothetical protein